MNRSSFSTEEKMAAVNLTEKKAVKEICNEMGITRKTLYNWKKELVPAQKSNSEPLNISTKYEKYNNIDYRNHLIVSSMKKINDIPFNRKLIQRLVKNHNVTVEFACEIIGLKLEDYIFISRKKEVNNSLVKKELEKLMKKSKAYTLSDCYALIKISHPDWPAKQIKRVFRDEKLSLSKAAQRGKKLAKDNETYYELIQDYY